MYCLCYVITPLFHSKTWNKVPCIKILVSPYFRQRSSFLSHPKCNPIIWFTLRAHCIAHPTQPFLLSRRPGSETFSINKLKTKVLQAQLPYDISTTHVFHVCIRSAALFWESLQRKAQYCSSGEQQGRLSAFQPWQAASAFQGKKRKSLK